MTDVGSTPIGFDRQSIIALRGNPFIFLNSILLWTCKCFVCYQQKSLGELDESASVVYKFYYNIMAFTTAVLKRDYGIEKLQKSPRDVIIF